MNTRASQAVHLFLYAGLFICLAPSCFAQAAPEKVSPFTAVRWDGEEPFVRFEGEWYLFGSLNGIPRADILSHAKEKHGSRWQKRFSEDLVELIYEMGHQLDVNVQLTLIKDGNPVNKQGVMTKANRRSVWEYNQNPEADSPDRNQLTKEPSPTGNTVTVTTEDTASNRAIARQFARHIDQIWEAASSHGKANLRLILKKDGKPYAGPLTLHTEFTFSATSNRGQYLSQGFNPNQSGRWVYEEIEPGIYDLVINGVGPFEGWSWTKKGVVVVANTSPLFEIDL